MCEWSLPKHYVIIAWQLFDWPAPMSNFGLSLVPFWWEGSRGESIQVYSKPMDWKCRAHLHLCMKFGILLIQAVVRWNILIVLHCWRWHFNSTGWERHRKVTTNFLGTKTEVYHELWWDYWISCIWCWFSYLSWVWLVLSLFPFQVAWGGSLSQQGDLETDQNRGGTAGIW